MGKARWILTADVANSLTGKRGDSCAVCDQADLDRRTEAARKGGVKVSVREVDDPK
jgi:hypothetical protein